MSFAHIPVVEVVAWTAVVVVPQGLVAQGWLASSMVLHHQNGAAATLTFLIEVKHLSEIHLDVDKLRAYMEAAIGHHIHVDNKVPSSGKEDLDCIKAYILKEEEHTS